MGKSEHDSFLERWVAEDQKRQEKISAMFCKKKNRLGAKEDCTMDNSDEIKVPTVKRFFSALTTVSNVVDDLMENGITTPDTVHLFVIFCSEVIVDFLANKFLALTVTCERDGVPLVCDVYVFDEVEARRAHVESELESGKKCKAITVEELIQIAPYEWSDPFNYYPIGNFAVLHTKID